MTPVCSVSVKICVGLATVLVLAHSSSAISVTSSIFGAPGFVVSTGTGFKPDVYVSTFEVRGTTLANDGTLVSRLMYYENQQEQYRANAMWRADDPVLFLSQSAINPNNSPVIKNINHSKRTLGFVPDTTDYGITYSPDGVLTTLPNLRPGDVWNEVADMNESGVIVGRSFSDWGYRAVKWTTPDTIYELPILEPTVQWRHSAAYGVNDIGQLTGKMEVDDSIDRAVVWEADNTIRLLPHITDSGREFLNTTGNFISNNGIVVGEGSYYEGNVWTHVSVIWTADGHLREIGHLQADEILGSQKFNIDDYGNLVGREHIRVGNAESQRAVKWTSDGVAHELARMPNSSDASSTLALQINKFGYIVGSGHPSFTQSFGTIPLLWKPNGEVVMLDDLIPEGSGWRGLYLALGITDTGWIKGYGYYDENGTAQPPGAYREWSMLLPEIGTYGLGDANFDESIDFADLLIVAQNYGDETNGSVDMGDFDLDGVIGFGDLLTVAQNYEGSASLLPSGASANFVSDWHAARALVPEPSALVAMAGIGILVCRRRSRSEALPQDAAAEAADFSREGLAAFAASSAREWVDPQSTIHNQTD